MSVTFASLLAEVDERPVMSFTCITFTSALCAGREFERAVPYLRHGCGLVDKNSAFATLLYAHLVNALREIGKPGEALEAAEQAERKAIRYPQISFCKGQALLALDRRRKPLWRSMMRL